MCPRCAFLSAMVSDCSFFLVFNHQPALTSTSYSMIVQLVKSDIDEISEKFDLR